ncbi:MAG: alanine:cation symporter family protein [Pseudomonadota bacterium]
MAVLFSVLLLISFGFAFNAVQSFIVAASVEASFGIPAWATGVAMTVAVALTIFGGIKRIAHVAEVVVPVMAAGYVLLALYVLATW